MDDVADINSEYWAALAKAEATVLGCPVFEDMLTAKPLHIDAGLGAESGMEHPFDAVAFQIAIQNTKRYKSSQNLFAASLKATPSKAVPLKLAMLMDI